MAAPGSLRAWRAVGCAALPSASRRAGPPILAQGAPSSLPSARLRSVYVLPALAALLKEQTGGDGVIRYASRGSPGGRYTHGCIEVAGGTVRMALSGLPVITAREICRLLGQLR